MTTPDPKGVDDGGRKELDSGADHESQIPTQLPITGPDMRWRIRVEDDRVVVETPPDGHGGGHELTVSQGRALANGILQAFAIACDGREPNMRDDVPVRWFVAVAHNHIRVSVEILEPTGVYRLEDAEAVGLAMALSQSCVMAERLGDVGLDGDGVRIIEETLRRSGLSASSLLDLASDDEGDDTSFGDDDER